MKRSLKRGALPLLLGAAVLLGGCQANTGPETSGGGSAAVAAEGLSAATIDTAALFSDRDLDGGYDVSAAVPIRLEGDGAACDSDAVSIDGTRITLLDEGTYLFSGTLTDGQIVVNADGTDKVQIVLAGAGVACADSAAIYALEADKVFLTLAEGTENILSNGGAYTAIDENNIDAVIYSKTDLTLNGSGSLTIDAGAGHGVVSKDELTITGGTYTVTAADHGMTGKDSLAIAGGSFTITSGKDGLHAENADDLSRGSLYIADGSFTIAAQGDAVSASGALQVDGGSFELTTGDGSASVTMSDGTVSAPGQPPQRQAQAETAQTGTAEETDTVSRKGLKADGTLTVNGGVFTIDSADDCLHAGGDLTVAAGEFTLSSGDDAVHSDAAVHILDGSFTIPYCYEGVEGLSVTVDGGSFHIAAYDDGLNAAGGADSSGFGGGFQDQFSADADSFITVNGGTFTIVSDGDCIDSNGDLTINGGTLDLTCNGNGNTALDANGTYANNGGNLTTNDGSEFNPGGMGGGMAEGGRPGGDGAQAEGGRPAGGGPPSGNQMQPTGQ